MSNQALWYGLSYWWGLTRREWARFAEARNVRAGGVDPPRRRRNIGVGTTHN
jgi:hypothetical protein